MKTLPILLCLMSFTISINAQQHLTGIWNTGKDNTKIEITEVDGVVQGKIFSSDNANAQIGKLLLKDVKSVDGEWKGKLFAVKRGKWMDAVLEEKSNQLLITVNAGLRNKTLKWLRD